MLPDKQFEVIEDIVPRAKHSTYADLESMTLFPFSPRLERSPFQNAYLSIAPATHLIIKRDVPFRVSTPTLHPRIMDYLSIKLVHLVGIMLVFLGLGGMVFAAYAGFGPARKTIRRGAALCHGIGLLFLLGSGLAMLSSLGLLHGDPPGWVKAKMFIWLLLGGSISLAARYSRAIWILILAWVLLGAAAAYLGLYKPF